MGCLSDKAFEAWKTESLFNKTRLRELGLLIDKWRGGVPEELSKPGRGAFNVWIRMKFSDGSAVARIPIPGKTILPEEKVEKEVAVMRFLQQHTGIPVTYYDFRPTNVLANNESKVAGAVDWEFTYAAPPGFAHSPPFWLLLELPEYWPYGIDDWANLYEKRLQTFLQVLHEREEQAIREGKLLKFQNLSQHMRENWESGDFWISYAARRSWAF